MTVDINRLSSQLAANGTISDYDFWRAIKTINEALRFLEQHDFPIPMEIIQARRIMKQARSLRSEAES